MTLHSHSLLNLDDLIVEPFRVEVSTGLNLQMSPAHLKSKKSMLN